MEFKISAKLYKTDGTVIPIAPKNGKDFKFDELQALVGGFIQVLRPPSTQGVLFIINEEGKLLNLPMNKIASAAWHEVALPGDYIVGDMVVCHESQLE